MTYQRSQVYEALWRTFLRHPSANPGQGTVPPRFVSRMMKMAELGVPAAVAERPGSGGSVVFTEYDAFELAVVMTLQDGGAGKQAELAYLIRNIRPELRDEHTRIMADPPVKPGQPARYLVFRMIEIWEAGDDLPVADSDWTGIAPQPGFLPPQFLSELELFRVLRALAHGEERTPIRLVVELSNIAVAVARYLPEAPSIRRGRR